MPPGRSWPGSKDMDAATGEDNPGVYNDLRLAGPPSTASAPLIRASSGTGAARSVGLTAQGELRACEAPLRAQRSAWPWMARPARPQGRLFRQGRHQSA